MTFQFDEHGWLVTEGYPDRTTDIAPPEMPYQRTLGQPWPNFTGLQWVVAPYKLQPSVTEQAVSGPLTKLSFIRRFTLSERIHMTSSDDPIIQDGLLMSQVAEDITLTDPDTVAFVMYARDNGYITPERAEEILTNL